MGSLDEVPYRDTEGLVTHEAAKRMRELAAVFPGGSAVMRRLLVAEPALVPRRAHLILVAVPLQVLGGDAHPRRLRCLRWWPVRGCGGHEAIVSVPDAQTGIGSL